MEIKNEIAKGQTAPIEIIQLVLSRISGEAAAELDSIPLNLKRKHPDISNQLIEDVKRHCVKAQNAIAECGEVLDGVLDDFLTDSDTA
jgi:phage terminase Nu1 subunit (DNA packaging protein)